ncbi:MAG: hypothetical protein AB7F59_14245 [Bdellovibrionales bacterium]
MKQLLSLAILFIGTTTHACPDFSGRYVVRNLPIQIQQTACTSLDMIRSDNGSMDHYIADGIYRKITSVFDGNTRFESYTFTDVAFVIQGTLFIEADKKYQSTRSTFQKFGSNGDIRVSSKYYDDLGNVIYSSATVFTKQM